MGCILYEFLACIITTVRIGTMIVSTHIMKLNHHGYLLYTDMCSCTATDTAVGSAIGTAVGVVTIVS